MGQPSMSTPAGDGPPGFDGNDGCDHAAADREHKADQRDHAADEREHKADQREDWLMASSAQLTDRQRRFRLAADDHVRESRTAIARGHEAVDRSRARLRRASTELRSSEERAVREQAEIDREIARTEREEHPR